MLDTAHMMCTMSCQNQSTESSYWGRVCVAGGGGGGDKINMNGIKLFLPLIKVTK